MNSRAFLRLFFLVTSLLAVDLAWTQVVTPANYHQLKLQQALPPGFTFPFGSPVIPTISAPDPNRSTSDCSCYQEVDSTWTEITTWSGGTDDGHFGPLVLPFQFCFYGAGFDSTLFINLNGNVSFDQPAPAIPSSIPDIAVPMIAPFLADVDLNPNPVTAAPNGAVFFKVTPTAIFVNWENVGFFNGRTNRLNRFSLVLTDGNDPSLPIGQNVGFCYKDMQWTTGENAGGDTLGLGGDPATVGVNRGDGVDAFAFGRFDAAGTKYDGPVLTNDGIDWLDERTLTFSTCSATNQAPVATGLTLCDTLYACQGDTVSLELYGFGPEASQLTVVSVDSMGTSDFSVLSNIGGDFAEVEAQLVGTTANTGVNQVSFTLTDTGNPADTTSVTVTIVVDSGNVDILGNGGVCAGDSTMLSAAGSLSQFHWSTGDTTASIITGAGTYVLSATNNEGCEVVSDSFVLANATPAVALSTISPLCPGDSLEVSLLDSFSVMDWSTGDTGRSVVLFAGDYEVMVEDSLGCGDALQFSIGTLTGAEPDFVVEPPVGFRATSLLFRDLSIPADGGTITSRLWDFGDGRGISALEEAKYSFPRVGDFTITLEVTTSDGCVASVSKEVPIVTELETPNVITPNGDGYNEYLVFELLEFLPPSGLKIFNRGGTLVYETDYYQNNWDGYFLPEGVYFFVLETPRVRIQTGSFTLLR